MVQSIIVADSRTIKVIEIFDFMIDLINSTWEVDHFERFYYNPTPGQKRSFGDSCSISFARKVIELDPGGVFRFEVGDLHARDGFSASCPLPKETGFTPIALAFPSSHYGYLAATRYIGGFFQKWGAVFGKVHDLSYRLWQVSSDPRHYQSRYGDCSRFPRKRNRVEPIGLVETLDTSLNPGRGRIQNQFPCDVASDMWLGPCFWKHAKCSKEEAMTAEFFIEKRDTPDFLYLKSWPEPFTRPDGEQGRQQQRLWKFFFGEDCEWPPGSGRISDAPVGGPSEFTPNGHVTKTSGTE